MNKQDLIYLADWSEKIRASTVKRLKNTPQNSFSFSPTENGMSIADIATHILNSDKALMSAQNSHVIYVNLGTKNMSTIRNHEQFISLINDIELIGQKRKNLIISLNEKLCNLMIKTKRIRGEINIKFIVLLYEFLDHEIHHRGQLSIYLGLLEDKNT